MIPKFTTSRRRRLHLFFGILFLLVFVASWFFFATFDLPFAEWIDAAAEERVRGPLVYAGITIIATVFAPFSTVPIIPLAAQLWGWQTALIYSVIAWQIGASIDFWLARRFGRRIIGYFADLRKVDEFVVRFPEREHFLIIFLLRMVVPVDVLSYALGLVCISFRTYFWASFLGIIPFAFVLTYGGANFDSWRVVPVVVGGALLFFGVRKFFTDKFHRKKAG